MIELVLYADGHEIKRVLIEYPDAHILEQREAHIERIVNKVKADHSRGLSIVNKWEFWLEADSKMNNENFTTYEIELPDKRR